VNNVCANDIGHTVMMTDGWGIQPTSRHHSRALFPRSDPSGCLA
jgi:hypothetical protein